MIPLAQIAEPPAPMRASMDEQKLNDLAGDIRLRGILLNLLVVPAGDGYEIIDGHRRFLAARMVGLAEVPCMVHERNEALNAGAMLVANILREDVTAAEEGWYFLELVERHHWTEEALCQTLGRSADYIAERIALVRKDPEVAGANAERKIEYSVARELLRVNRHTAALILKCAPAEVSEEQERVIVEHRHYLLRLAIEGGAHARQVRSWVEQWKQTFVPAGAPGGDGTAPASMGSPAESPFTCVVCRMSHDPHNMKPVYVHFWELDLFIRACRESAEAARGA